MTLRHSTDQGLTWQTLPAVPATNVIFQDITCAVHGSDLWITYASGTAPFQNGKNTPADAVSVLHSANGGTSFDAVVTASSGAAGTTYLFPRLARSPAGSLEIVYYEGTEGNPAALMRATSKTGATWTTSKLADAGTFTLDRFLASWLGITSASPRRTKACSPATPRTPRTKRTSASSTSPPRERLNEDRP